MDALDAFDEIHAKKVLDRSEPFREPVKIRSRPDLAQISPDAAVSFYNECAFDRLPEKNCRF